MTAPWYDTPRCEQCGAQAIVPVRDDATTCEACCGTGRTMDGEDACSWCSLEDRSLEMAYRAIRALARHAKRLREERNYARSADPEIIDERDWREEQIERIHAAFCDCEDEWTNCHDLGECSVKMADFASTAVQERDSAIDKCNDYYLRANAARAAAERWKRLAKRLREERDEWEHTATDMLDLVAERDAARAEAAQYAHAIGRIEAALGIVGPKPLGETVAAVERQRAEGERLPLRARPR